MRMLPATKRPRRLHVAELLPLDVVRMHETPAHSERPNAYPHRPAVAVANPLGAFDNLNLFPRRRQPLERSRLRVPPKQPLGGGLNPGTCDEHFRPRHIFHRVLPARLARTALPGRDANRATGGTLRATGENRGREPISQEPIASPKERSSERFNESSFSALPYRENR